MQIYICRFFMFDYITFFFSKGLSFLVAPLYFHFGHTWLFIELCVIFNNLADTTAFFFVSFFFIGFIVFYRNYLFQSFSSDLFKNSSLFINYLPLFAYFSNFFSSFINLTFFLLDKFYSFFKKK